MVGLSLLVSVQALAHHGGDDAAIFKGSKQVDLTGVIVEVEWFNPHAFLRIDVTDAAGRVTRWRLELASPNTLTRQGWTRESLRKGDRVSVTGRPARDGSLTAYVRTGTLASGQKLSDTSKFVPSGADLITPRK
jgi:hypothetical protein